MKALRLSILLSCLIWFESLPSCRYRTPFVTSTKMSGARLRAAGHNRARFVDVSVALLGEELAQTFASCRD